MLRCFSQPSQKTSHPNRAAKNHRINDARSGKLGPDVTVAGTAFKQNGAGKSAVAIQPSNELGTCNGKYSSIQLRSGECFTLDFGIWAESGGGFVWKAKAVVVVVCIWQIHLQPPKAKIELEHITLKAEVPHLNIIVAVGSGHWPLVVGFFWLIVYHILVIDSDKTTPLAIENGPFEHAFCFEHGDCTIAILVYQRVKIGWTRKMLTCWN